MKFRVTTLAGFQAVLQELGPVEQIFYAVVSAGASPVQLESALAFPNNERYYIQLTAGGAITEAAFVSAFPAAVSVGEGTVEGTY